MVFGLRVPVVVENEGSGVTGALDAPCYVWSHLLLYE